MRQLVRRLAISVGLIVALLAICLRLPHVDHATVAMLMLLAIVGLAKMWGRVEALSAALVGGIGFEHYFLPSRGLDIANPEHWVALTAFLITAVVTGQVATQLKQRRNEAVEREIETEKLYRLVNTLLESGSAESTAAQMTEHILEIFGADGAALYDKHTNQVSRAGPRAFCISDQALHQTATSGHQVLDIRSAYASGADPAWRRAGWQRRLDRRPVVPNGS